jgi:hypothetical protein
VIADFKLLGSFERRLPAALAEHHRLNGLSEVEYVILITYLRGKPVRYHVAPGAPPVTVFETSAVIDLYKVKAPANSFSKIKTLDTLQASPPSKIGYSNRDRWLVSYYGVKRSEIEKRLPAYFEEIQRLK